MKILPILMLTFAMSVPCTAQTWTPDSATISRVEQSIKPGGIPKWASGHSPAIAEYARYYVGYTVDGHRMIRGELVAPSYSKVKPGIYRVGSEYRFPGIKDGGCGVVRIAYDVEKAHMVSLQCSGDA